MLILFIAFFVIAALVATSFVVALILSGKPVGEDDFGNELLSQADILPQETPAIEPVKPVSKESVTVFGTPINTDATTCRDEVIAAAKAVVETTGNNEFSVKDIVKYMIDRGTEYSESTIRTHVASRCCANASNNNNGYKDFLRIERGKYKLADPAELALV